MGKGSTSLRTTTEHAKNDSLAPATRSVLNATRNQTDAASSFLLLSLRLVVAVLIIGLWLILTSLHVVSSLFLPSPANLWTSLEAMSPDLPSSLAYSLGMTLGGFSLGVLVGVVLGLAVAYSIYIRHLFGGVMTFLRPVPVFALIPLFVLWFGVSWRPQVALIALGTSVILGVTTTEAVKNVPTIFVKAALTLGAGRRHVYRTIVVPAIAPHLAGSIRVAAAASWGLDVAAEFIGAQIGLGHLMIVREEYLDTGGIIDIVLIYAVLAIAFDWMLARLMARAFKWTERTQSGTLAGAILGR